MGKDSTQKAARQRRRDRQKKLVEVGRQAEDLVSKHRQQATEAMVRVERLEAELAEAWKALGDATNREAAAGKDLRATSKIL